MIKIVWQDCWSLKLTEDAKCVALNKTTIFGIQKEIDRINASDNMAVIYTMIEKIDDLKLKSSKDDNKTYQGYDAIIGYRVKKEQQVSPKLGGEVFANKPKEPTTNIPTVDLGDVAI